jgi:pimeloyl-ACP methyl ester carboxylesterase
VTITSVNGHPFTLLRANFVRLSTVSVLALWLLVCIAALFFPLSAQPAPSSISRARTVTVEKDVNLEVLDWGGTGRPLILLQGLGGVAHDYDEFAPRFTAHYHVYGITRRGFGNSSKPTPSPANYSAERLGKDILIVIQSLKLDRPVLVGQSIAGEELSWIGTFHPDIVAGLIYLEAVDSYSFYDPKETDMVMDMVDVRHKIDAFEASEPLSAAVLGQIRDSAAALSQSAGRMAYNVSASGGPGDPALPPVGLAVKFGEEKFTTVHAPMLAIMACPHDYSQLAERNAKAAASLKNKDQARCMEQINSLKTHNASAQVVVLPNADHQIVRTNESDVVRAMTAFLAKLQ